MRKFFLVALLFVSQFAWAEEPKKDDKPAEKPAEKQTVNKPVIKDGAAEKAETKVEVKVEELPLHEHPTLVHMLTKSNTLRQRVGLRPHRINAKLTKAAQDHANYMAATHTMDHYNNGGYQGRAVRHGFKGFVLENIAMGQPSVDSVFNTWQNSGGHWASIISNTAEAGFGYQISPNGTCFWCSVYGTEKEVPAVIVEAVPDDKKG